MNRFDTSENKITYLIGAGASANALPVVKGKNGFANSLREFAKWLENDSNFSSSYSNEVKDLCNDINWVAENSDLFGTPDTFARYLYLKNKENELRQLKIALIFFFTVEQLLQKKNDNRCLSFITSILQTTIFPTNIKILNWNYDIQFELSSLYYSGESLNIGTGAISHSPPLIGYYPQLGFEYHSNHEQNDNKEISLVHLNGIAGYYFNKNNNLILFDYLNNHPQNINDIIEKVLLNNQDKHYLFTFAWETRTDSALYLRNRLKISKEIVKNSNVLVVIGYSFPLFNRQIDKEIFKSLLEGDSLNKIYFQDPYRSGDFLKKQFNLPDRIEIETISEVDNYFIPNEL